MRQSQAGLHRLDIAEKAGEYVLFFLYNFYTVFYFIVKVVRFCSLTTKPKALADGPETVMPRPWTWTARLIASLLEPRKGPCLSQVGWHSITGLPELGRLVLC